jgi:hypothetical protein
VSLSLPRRLVCDLLHFAKAVPSVPVQRQVEVGRLRRARARMTCPPGWCAIFTKAFAIVALREPALRRAYFSFPYPHLYEHPHSVASVAIEREYQGERGVFVGALRGPERQSLAKLEAALAALKERPVQAVPRFRRELRVSRLPLPVRRLVWWLGLNASGARRAKYMGTFGVSVYSALGAESLHPISPLTSTLTYGVIGANGRVPVRLVYDHRVLDGATVARALGLLEQVLDEEILAELREQRVRRAA